MDIRPTKTFVVRFTEDDLYLFVRMLECVLALGPEPRTFDGSERAVLHGHWRELSRTFETAHDDDELEASGAETSPAAPVCAVHDKPMVLQPGKRGPFWSCHERSADGSFCSYRPPRE